jgi:transposase
MVLACFHVTRLGFKAVDDVRRRVQQASSGHRDRKDDPLYRIRRVLRRRADHLTPDAWEKLRTCLPSVMWQEIGHTWISAQSLRLIYERSTVATPRS